MWPGCYGTETNKMEEGKQSGAHRDRAGRVSELGGAPEWPNSTEKILGGRRGGNVGGGVPGLFWSRETTRRTREDLRSSGRRRGGERSTVAAAIGVGGGGGSRVRGRESRGRRGGRGRVRAVRGSCVASSGASRESGGSRRWPAGGEVARARAGERRAHALVLLSREEDDREAVVVGWASGRSWAGQVSR